MNGQAAVHELRVRTPEGVAFTFRLASPALRLLALALDVLIVAAACWVVIMVVQLLSLLSEDVAGMLMAILFFAISTSYRIVMEWRWRGQSIGKRVLRLRVVDEGGRRLAFSQIVLRNLIRYLDALPLAYLVGGIAALVNRRGQRLGDLAAGTLVIWEPPEPEPDLSLLESSKYNSLRSHVPVVARLRQAVTPASARVAWSALARREQLEAGARLELFAELAEYFRGLTPIPPEAVEGVSDEQFVRNVVDVLFVNRS